MVIVVCQQCKEEFNIPPHDIANGFGKFCTQKCMGLAMVGDKNPAKRPEVRKKLSEKAKLRIGEKNGMYGVHRFGENNPFYGKHHSPETVASLRANHQGKQSGKSNPMYGKPSPRSKGEWFIRSDGSKVWLRSSYEVGISTILDQLGLEWQYEPKCFELDSCTYIPDFLVEDCIWWEIKGYLRDNARKKLDQFSDLYPEEYLRILYKSDIIQLEQTITNGDVIDIMQIGQRWVKS